jgi:TFIIF-interacting CTD phosphatase-like protein
MRSMLRRLVEHFELIVFTSSDPDYAMAAIDIMEGNEKYFAYRLTKNDCITVPINR